MKYVDIKAYDGSSIHTSCIAMGSTMSMERLTDNEKFELYDYFIDNGGNCIDTARAYHDGEAEQMVGRFLQSRKNRNHVVISTKGGHPLKDGMQARLTRKEIFEDLEESLRVLGTDYVDYYWIHKDDPQYPIEDLVDTLNVMIKEGKVRKVGASNFTIERLAAAEKYAKESGQHGFGACQIQWSLAATEDKYFEMFGSLVMTPERYRYYLENQMPVFAFSAQAQGFFARVAADGIESLPPFIVEQYHSEDNMKRLELVKEYAKAHDCSISAVCLGYLIYNKLPCVSLIGAQTIEMLSQSLEAVNLDMSEEDADALFNL